MRSVSELMNLSGRTALVTGGAGPLGRAMVDTVAELGADVIVLDRNISAAEDFATEVRSRCGIKAAALKVDLENSNEIGLVVPFIEGFTGRLDVLINNAALVGTSDLDGWGVPFEQQSVNTWRRALETNLTAVFELTQACVGLLRASTHGSVINTASIYGVLGPDLSLYEGTSMGNPAAYAASKGGLVQLTRWLATTLAPDVRVNAISPGGIERGQPAVFQNRYAARTPLRRMGREEDVKGATALLASDMSSYVTGQNLLLDGGWSTW